MSRAIDRHRMRRYWAGMDALAGDMGTGGAPSVVRDDEYGPLSPEQLSRVGRPLSKEEQRAVDEWRAANLKAAQAKEDAERRAKMARAMDPSPLASSATSAAARSTDDEGAVPTWQWLLLGLGIGASGFGVYLAVRR